MTNEAYELDTCHSNACSFFVRGSPDAHVCPCKANRRKGFLMDPDTLHTYHTHATALCARYRLAAPTAMYRLIQRLFHPGQPTADIGCGSGRDVAWLVQHSFPTVGYDASSAMLAEARAAYTDMDLREASLPHLAGIPDNAYTNLLCSATLMHLHRDAIPTALCNLARILCPRGRLLLSYRHSQTPTEREPDGRLFTAIAPDALPALLHNAGFSLLTTEQQPDATRPDIQWDVLVAEQPVARTLPDAPPCGGKRAI